jgi:hypothetical protein
VKSAPISDPAFERGLAESLKGNDESLFRFLRRHSGLPGVKANLYLASAFGDAMASNAAYQPLLVRLLSQSEEDAPGGTELEFLPVCGVYGQAAMGARGTASKEDTFARLREAADDGRFRVRDAVSQGLATLGAAAPDATARELAANWVDGYLYAANALEALSEGPFLDNTLDVDAVVRLLTHAFELASRAPRSAERYPGYKSLINILGVAPQRAAVRFGTPIFDCLKHFAIVKEPMIRDAITRAVGGTQLAGRNADDVRSVKSALAATAPIRRDPTTYVGKTRGRGKKNK